MHYFILNNYLIIQALLILLKLIFILKFIIILFLLLDLSLVMGWNHEYLNKKTPLMIERNYLIKSIICCTKKLLLRKILSPLINHKCNNQIFPKFFYIYYNKVKNNKE